MPKKDMRGKWKRPKGRRIYLHFLIGRGPDARDILKAIRNKAVLAKQSLPVFVLTSCLKQNVPIIISKHNEAKAPVLTPPKMLHTPTPKASANERKIDYSNSEEPPAPHIDISQMPSGRPQNS